MSSAPSRSSTGALTAALRAATARVVRDVVAIGVANPVVLIDGRSGAGKSTLARMLVAAWPLAGHVQLVDLDAMYPGWDGLAGGVESARTGILHPHARGDIGLWRRWDWEAEAEAETHAVDPSVPLVVEGAGIVTPATARLSDVRVWLDSPVETRRTRALERDGETYRPHWERWAEQEERHLARNDPRAHATAVFAIP